MPTPLQHSARHATWLCIAMLFWMAPASKAYAADSSPLHMLVMDPMALPLSCSCVPGTAQRRYDQLADYLAERLGRPVQTIFEESMGLGLRRINTAEQTSQNMFDLVIGKRSVVDFDSAMTQTKTRLIAELTDKQGRTDLRGLFMVRSESPFQSLPDLAGRRVVIGPEEDREAHGAAIDLMNAKLRGAVSYESLGSIDAAVFALIDGEADAAVISNYMTPLLEGCGKIDVGSIRSVGETESVPFVGVYVTDAVDEAAETRLRNLLVAAKADASLILALESRDGFLPVQTEPRGAAKKPSTIATTLTTWSDWRGENRAGLSDDLPRSLPAKPRELWRVKLTGPAVAGPAATERFVIVPDKDTDLQNDIFRCLDAKTGKEIWRLEYEAAAPVEYSNAPRATPVIKNNRVYLLGALGDLHCLRIETGEVVWKLNYYDLFGGDVLTWGSSSPPLVVGPKLIINPGNPATGKASIAALNRYTGKVLWQTSGHAAAYSAFIYGEFGGVNQIVGYDVAGLGGWDLETGKRLWEMIPTEGSDFNVTTPVDLGGRLLLATENNATRIYDFNNDGTIKPEPTLTNEEMAPDSCSPVVYNGRVYANAYGELFCLDLKTLEMIWVAADDMFYEHSNLIAGNGRVLVSTMNGDVLLLDAADDDYKPLGHLRPFGQDPIDTLSHPALVGNRLYVRSKDALICLQLTTSPSEP